MNELNEKKLANETETVLRNNKQLLSNLYEAKKNYAENKVNYRSTQNEAHCDYPEAHNMIQCISTTMHRVPSVYDGRDPARPIDFRERHSTICSTLRTFFLKLVEASPTEPSDDFLKKLHSHLAPEHIYENFDDMRTQLTGDNFRHYRRAVMIASFSEILFENFENAMPYELKHIYDRNDCVNNFGSVSQPTETFFNKGLQHFLTEHRSTFDKTINVLYNANTEFKIWANNVIVKFIALLYPEEQVLPAFFSDTSDTSDVGMAFWEVLQNVWALHKLSFAYPVPVHIIRFPYGSTPDDHLCISTITELSSFKHKWSKEYKVYCTATPGFELDGTIIKCDVVWF